MIPTPDKMTAEQRAELVRRATIIIKILPPPAFACCLFGDGRIGAIYRGGPTS